MQSFEQWIDKNGIQGWPSTDLCITPDVTLHGDKRHPPTDT